MGLIIGTAAVGAALVVHHGLLRIWLHAIRLSRMLRWRWVMAGLGRWQLVAGVRWVAILPGRQALSVSTVQLSGAGRATAASIESLGRYKGLGLGRDGSKDTFLAEAHAVGAAAVLGVFEAGATNLAPAAVLASNSCALSRRRLAHAGLTLRRRALAVRIMVAVRRWPALRRPLLGVEGLGRRQATPVLLRGLLSVGRLRVKNGHFWAVCAKSTGL